MNYIRLLTEVTEKFKNDDRLNATHISIYYALFQYWNLFRFRKQFFVQREEIMQASKVGSLTTYHRCIRELSKWNYITYLPSKNPLKGSQVMMSIFWSSSKQVMDELKTSDNRPVNKFKPCNEQVEDKSGTSPGQALVYETNNSKPTKETKYTRDRPKGADEVVSFFKEQRWSVQEALKFYHHYEANGWKVGGNNPVQNWKSLANSWVLKAEEFKKSTRKETDHLKTTKNKDYGQPL
ncbi:hypothetical protein APR41_04505 [Salegentibacter salinarum]|uniref:Uncharacterized protein n=1 Tax=Salegentibacter salinarum TaxID=447422 RepID=A0A2N0TUK0_9FLAO|nr:hypothetical protein [Salegentibacter salinarum]PKD18417.1 hypothetical protein APR41_04505 [Salegentibacter salinarum]SKB45479.1 hypothetical protein SAMN05660903_00925 [Salegentibacter salinarum]